MKRIVTLMFLMLFPFLFSFGQRIQEKDNEMTLNRDLLTKALKINAKTQERASFEFTQKLDSVVNIKYGLNDSREKEVFRYDPNGFNDLKTKYFWNKTNNKYDEASKEEYTHDARGNITKDIFYAVAGPYGMTPQWKYERSFDSNNHVLVEIRSVFTYMGSKEWVNDQKDEYTYNAKGNILENLQYFWDTTANQWVKRFKAEYTYNSNDKLIEDTSFSWDISTNQWVNSEKYEFDYNSQDLVSESVSYLWDKTGMSWLNNLKNEYIYEANGDLINDKGYRWDKSTKQWHKSSEMQYAYDASGHLMSVTTYGDLFGTWKLISRYDYTYDKNHLITEVLLPHTYEYVYDLSDVMLTEEKYYVGNTLQDDKSFYYSKQGSLLVDKYNMNKLRIYPNPVQDKIRIKSDSPVNHVEVFSLLGRRVKEFKGSENTISLGDLSRGIYMIRISSEQGIAVRKLIKL